MMTPTAARPACVASLTATLLSVLTANLISAQPLLDARRDFVVGRQPVDVMVADFDQDGVLDLITVGQASGDISLMRGFGDGTFRLVGSVVPGSVPQGGAFADVNDDGHPDLITANFLSQDVTVNLGDGLGGFGAPLRTGVNGTANGLAVGHWDGDGVLDVATVNTNQDQVSILLGLGDGQFGSLQQINVGLSPRHILTADFDGDGNADLAVTSKVSQNVQVWSGNGAGLFTLTSTLSTGAGSVPLFSTTGDFNGDGRPDIAVCNQAASTVKVFPANAGGGFGAATTVAVGDGPRAAHAVDINQDGDLDLVVGEAFLAGTGDVAVVLGNGSGGFGAATITTSGPRPGALASGDFNGDGNVDIVTANLTANTVSILETVAGGLFVEAARVDFSADSLPWGAIVADFDNDGNPDVAVALEANDEMAILSGDGAGGFAAPVLIGTGIGSGPRELATLDTNLDGLVDIVVANQGNDSLSILQNTGTGFNATSHIPTGACAGPVDVATGEVNGDSFPDVVLMCEDTFHMCTFLGTGGTGNGAIGQPTCTIVDPTVLDPTPGGITLGQFNFDALEDAAITSKLFDWVLIAFADGFGGILDIPGNFLVGDDPRGIVTGDLNLDGFDDLVVANSVSANISALLGDGGGAFSFPSLLSPAGQGPFDVALADFNLDGKVDVAVTNANANNVSLLLGDGFGQFSKVGDFGTRALPLGIATGDFNLDGKPDLVVSDGFSSSLTILMNLSQQVDPLANATVSGTVRTIYRWGLVPGAIYDVIRGDVGLMSAGPGFVDLGPTICLAENTPDTDISTTPDTGVPPVGGAFFYLVRPINGGFPGSYGESTDGFERIVTDGSGCLDF